MTTNGATNGVGLPGRCVRRRRRCRGVVAVEMALIAPIVFLLLIGLIVGGLGVFRYEQVAMLAREGARWASVHGPECERVTHAAPITDDDVYTNAIAVRAVGLDASALSYDLAWDTERATVAVTVRYLWLPEALFAGGTLSSKAEMVVTY
jgi:Flp pilus assembly protein TadG